MSYTPGRWYVFVQCTNDLPEEAYGFGRNREENVQKHAEALREEHPNWTVTYGRRNPDGSRKKG